MERDRLICCLTGSYVANKPNITSPDLKLEIDNHLIKCHLPPLGLEGDNDLLQELLDETIFSVLAQGINRKQRRSIQRNEI